MRASTRFGLMIALGSGLFACKSGSNSKDPAKPTETPPTATDTSLSTGTKTATDDTETAAGDTETDVATGTSTEQAEDTIAVTGTIALNLNLLQGQDPAVTHVVARNTDDNGAVVAEVGENGAFSLDVPTDASYVLTYVNADASGADMLVSTFGSGELDTLATTESSENVTLGNVDVSAEQATTALSEGDLLDAIGLSEAAAATVGAQDDVCLRYTNPDIDGDGQLDALANQRFILDFHNRFNVTQNGGAMAMKDIKNAFPPDDAGLEFTGSGIIPWFEDSAYAEPVTNYSWTFTSDAALNDTCANVAGSTLTAGTECQLSLTGGAQSVQGRPSIELKAAVPGTYVLKAGGKTFTWTNVAVSDFSGGEGFIALFIRADVSDADKLTGISWRWRRKVSGAWVPATPEELRLLVAGGGGFISLKVDGSNSGKGLGVKVPLETEGSIAFATATFAAPGQDGAVSPEGVTKEEVQTGLAWSRVLENPGISYDDKLGMRFFFGFTGPND